jgi:hypothetical protein
MKPRTTILKYFASNLQQKASKLYKFTLRIKIRTTILTHFTSKLFKSTAKMKPKAANMLRFPTNMPSATKGAFLKNRPPEPPEKLFITLRAVGSTSFEA